MNGIDEHRLTLTTALSRDEVDEVLRDLDEQIDVLHAAERAAEARYRQLLDLRNRVRTPRSGLDVSHPIAVVSSELMFLAEQNDTATKESYRKVAAWFADIAVLALEEAVLGTAVEPARVVAPINPGLLSRPQLVELLRRYRPEPDQVPDEAYLTCDDVRVALWGSEWAEHWLCRLPEMPTLERLPALSEEVSTEVRATLRSVLVAVQAGQTAIAMEDRPLTVDELAKARKLNSAHEQMPTLLIEFARAILRGLPTLRAAD